jgi:nucleoside-diphosphate-sugar epimerase
MTTVFLTGASGNTGQETLKQLLLRGFEVVALVLPAAEERRVMAPFAGEPGLRILYGDLTNFADVLAGVRQADIVLHLGGLVSPLADRMPALTARVNVGGIRNIIRAIHRQPYSRSIKLVHIGSVAQTGDRNPPVHWGRVGDPIRIGPDDHYALSKIIAEREVIESGLRFWVSLRQTAVAHWNLLEIIRGPDAAIAFRQPINGVFEWVTVRDTAKLLANVCEPDVAEHFWNQVYNIGGGESCRLVNHEFMRKMAGLIGVDDFRRIFEPNWFAIRNFHGHWFEDSDRLQNLLQFRSETIDDYIAAMQLRPSFLRQRIATQLPAPLIKAAMRSAARKPGGTLHAIQTADHDRIAALSGSRSAWERIPPWNQFQLASPSRIPVRLDHGYDESKPLAALAIGDMHRAAAFRGGACLSASMAPGDLRPRLAWRCAFGHIFAASPMLVLRAGHWCPQCLAQPQRSEQIASRNPFFAQVSNLPT